MEINFHIPDFTRNIRLNLKLIDTIKEHPEWFHEGVKIASSYGAFYSSLWNGGRAMLGQMNESLILPVMKAYNDRGVPIRYTFTNLMITEEHLNDEFCNKQLQLADNGFNEVIVSTEILEKYIREKYPNYKIISSTCKQIEDMEELKKELEKDFYLVVLDYNLNHRMDILENISDKGRCELLVNACCIPNCKVRGEHYRAIGKEVIAYEEWMGNPVKKIMPFPSNPFHCPNPQHTIYDGKDYITVIKPEDIYGKLAPMGYKHFKIEGRSTRRFTVLENYIHYMVKEEYKNICRLNMALDISDPKYLPEFIMGSDYLK